MFSSSYSANPSEHSERAPGLFGDRPLLLIYLPRDFFWNLYVYIKEKTGKKLLVNLLFTLSWVFVRAGKLFPRQMKYKEKWQPHEVCVLQ